MEPAAVQTSPVFLDRDAAVEKACEPVAKAAADGAGRIRRQFDPMGHYSRSDVFKLVDDIRERPAGVWQDCEAP